MTSLASEVLAQHSQSAGSLICEECLRWWPCDAARAATALQDANKTILALVDVAAERDALRRVAKAAQGVERAFAAYWKGDGVQEFDRLSNRMVELRQKLAALAATSPAEKETT